MARKALTLAAGDAALDRGPSRLLRAAGSALNARREGRRCPAVFQGSGRRSGAAALGARRHGVLGASGRRRDVFLGVRAVPRATAAQVALLTTLPPLLGSSAQIFSAWLGGHFGRRQLVLGAALLQALLWLPILLVPLLFRRTPYRRCSCCSRSISARTTSRPRSGRASCATSSRSGGAGATSAIGRAHDDHDVRRARDLRRDAARARHVRRNLPRVRADLPRRVRGAAVSVYHLTFLLRAGAARRPTPDMHIEHWWRSLLSTGAIGFSTYFALMNAAVGISSPFFTVYMLRDLELSYLEFTALSGMSVIVQYLMLSTWGRIADVYGNRLILIVTSVSLPMCRCSGCCRMTSGGCSFSRRCPGLSWSGFTLSCRQPALRARAAHAARGVRRVPQRGHGRGRLCRRDARCGARARAAAAHRAVRRNSTCTSNLLYLFALSGLTRAILATLLARRIRDFRKPRRTMSAHALVMRVTGFNAMLG